jgi:threonyl-tRNA synthetase
MESHQELGHRLELFFIDETSQGSIFWKPRGALLFNNLIKIIRDLYDIYGYMEVVSPNIYEKKLWETSGHWAKFKDNMFILNDIHHNHGEPEIKQTEKKQIETNEKFDGDEMGVFTQQSLQTQIELKSISNSKSIDNEKQIFSIKPMSCPGHCLIFRNMRPLSKDLPIRMAEFAVLHRNEASGALHGLTRVRRFQQDDAHIFCRMDQIHEEVLNTLKMVERVYNLFNLKYNIKLSTRPDTYIGTVEIWNKAENILEDVIKQFTGKKKVKKNIGDGAFYGPKIDITLVDKYKRNVQCGTVQLDFNLPAEDRFNLKYTDETDQTHHQPVIVHRAVLGSVERFIGIILEHTQGRLPIQVSPYPIIVITVHKEFNSSANLLKNYIRDSLRKRNVKLVVDIDDSADDIKTKVKSAEKKGYCYIVTVGKNETVSLSKAFDMNDPMSAQVAVRFNKEITQYSVANLLDKLENETRLC